MNIIGLLGTGRRILQEVKAAITSSEDIIPREQIPLMSAVTFEKWDAEFGPKFTAYACYQLQVDSCRIACNAAEKALKLRYHISAANIAITKFHVGESAEAAHLAFVKAQLAGIANVVLVQISNSPVYPIPLKDSDRYYNHAFVLLGVNGEEFIQKTQRNKKDILNTLNAFKDAFILDPLLNLMFKVAKIGKEKKFFAYLKLWNIQWIDQAFGVDPRSNASLVFKEAEAVYDYVVKQELLFKKPSIPLLTDFLQGKAQKIIEELGRIFASSRLQWEKDIQRTMEIWCEGPPELLSPLKEYLNKHGVECSLSKIKDQEKHVLLLTNPDLALLRPIQVYIY